MVNIPSYVQNQTKVSLPRRMATYITSMNFAKVFRRHQHPRGSSSPLSKSPDKSTVRPHHHHQYARPFSYHIPSGEKLTPSSLIQPSTIVPYRIGLSSDSTLLNNGQTNETDEIVRLPIRNGRGYSPKARKDRRYQSQLTANKRWLFRSMETLDGWKEKVFPQKTRPSNSSSQSRSRSVENLADEDPDENILRKSNPPLRAVSPNRSIDAITNRVINSIGIQRKPANSIPNISRSPALTIEKRPLFTQLTGGPLKQYNNPSAILDFRELSALEFSPSRTTFNDENETNSLTPSETIPNGINLSDDENEDFMSNLSFPTNGYHYNQNDIDRNEIADAWDFSITWIDSLKEQHSPQRKIQFYENLIKLLEQDTLNIDELLVLRKVLTKICPIDETTKADHNPQTLVMESKTNGTKSLHAPNKIRQRSKLPTMTHHTAQRCSAIIDQSPLAYETLHEQNSGHRPRSPTALLAMKGKPCLIGPDSHEKDRPKIEVNYPQHLNPFDEETDLTPSAPPSEAINPQNNDSIRRYFERLTLLETIYEKLNAESNKTPVESTDQQISPKQENTTHPRKSLEKRMPMKDNTTTRLPISSPNKSETVKMVSNKFLEMNVDGNGSISSEKSSIKRRAPTAPHISQKKNNPIMFTLSSADLNVAQKPLSEIHIPIQIQSSNGRITHDTAASCDDDGHVFVYDPPPNHFHEESTIAVPKKTERIQQWLSTCETKEEVPLPQNISPKNQYKMRCIAKSMRHASPSPQPHHENDLLSPRKSEVEPGRFRSCLKIHLETTEPTTHRSRASSATSRCHQRQPPMPNEDLDITEEEYFQESTLLPTRFSRDHHAVFL